MKNKPLNNMGLKILSIILALLLWMTVMIVSDYTVKVEIKDIPVTKKNIEVFDKLDKVYDVTSGDTVDIIVKGRRSIVSELKAEDFLAIADLSKMSITNTVQIDVCAKNQDIDNEISISCVDNTMTLNLETKKKEQFPVKVTTTGEPKSGFAVSNTEVLPNIVMIEGPESAINKITEVLVTVDVNNKSEDFKSVKKIKILDAYGEEITNEKIVMKQADAEAAVEINPVKSVPLEIKSVGQPLTGYAVNDIVCQSKEVVIVGDVDKLDKIDKIVVDNLSVNGLDEDVQTSVDLSKYIPEGVKLVSPIGEILVAIDIEPITDKYLPIVASDITLVNKNADYEYEILASNNLRIKLLGMEKIIDEVSIEKLLPRIDCTNLVEGENQVDIKITDADGVSCEVLGNITINVTVKTGEEQKE